MTGFGVSFTADRPPERLAAFATAAEVLRGDTVEQVRRLTMPPGGELQARGSH